MDERLARTIQNVKDFDQLSSLEVNIRNRDRLDDEVAAALKARATELVRAFVGAKTRLDLNALSPAEEAILRAVGEYTGILRRKGKYPSRTLEQLRNHGLLGAAEAAVCRAKPTDGFQALADEELEELSYEQIILDHSDEFSERALWFARRTLGLQNDKAVPPAASSGLTQVRTTQLIQWFREQAEIDDGVLPHFSNADTASVLGIDDMQRYGRVLGNVQSRLDFACYLCGLPPLGLAANAPFGNAWGHEGRTWAFPVQSMALAARRRKWSNEDFDAVLRRTQELSGQASPLWLNALAAEERKVRLWAEGLATSTTGDDAQDETASAISRNPPWSRDELILALDLYLRHRSSPPGKDSDEVSSLSEFLNKMGRALGLGQAETYRNANGVYMKLMNFRRFDPEYAKNGKVGLSRGNKDEKIAWDEFSGDPERLSAVVAAIRAAVDQHTFDHGLAGHDEPGALEAEEGRVLTRLHRYRERNRKLVEARKQKAVAEFGRVFCEACGFDFGVVYGPESSHIIDCHHTKPVHTLVGVEKTRVQDLALLCANCHRVVHAARPWLTLEQLRIRLKK